MQDLNRLHPESSNEKIVQLEIEVASLERELNSIEQELSEFESKIRFYLHHQLVELHDLTTLYKSQKKAKKEKRKEQKRRGKNYQEPIGLKIPRTSEDSTEQNAISLEDKNERKRLYKEAVVHVHPDKFGSEEDDVERANEITAQLNQLYQTGQLEELKELHEHIVSGNAMAYVPFQASSIQDKVSLEVLLKKKIEELKERIDLRKSSHTYEVLKTYENPLTYIDELRIYVKDKIKKMKRRTRTK